MLRLAGRLFGGLTGNWSLPEVPFRWNGGERRIDRDSGQIDLVLALPVPGSADPGMPAIEVLTEILGGGASSSRLFSELRERRALCYDINASLERARDGGLLAVTATIAPGAVNKLLSTVCSGLVRLACEAPEAVEVARAVAFLRTSEALSLEVLILACHRARARRAERNRGPDGALGRRRAGGCPERGGRGPRQPARTGHRRPCRPGYGERADRRQPACRVRTMNVGCGGVTSGFYGRR